MFANRFMLKDDPTADLAAIRIASVNPILDPWIYILLRRSLFRRLISLSRHGSSTRSGSSPSPQTNLFYPQLMTDGTVFDQLVCNASVITQLPTAVKFTPYDAESLCQTWPKTCLTPVDVGCLLRLQAARCRARDLNVSEMEALQRGWQLLEDYLSKKQEGCPGCIWGDTEQLRKTLWLGCLFFFYRSATMRYDRLFSLCLSLSSSPYYDFTVINQLQDSLTAHKKNIIKNWEGSTTTTFLRRVQVDLEPSSCLLQSQTGHFRQE